MSRAAVIVARAGDIEITAREYQVLSLAAEGFAAREIGAQLSISCRTVEIYRQQVNRKLNARNTTHAVAVAIGTGLIVAPELA